jgi:hypothetical protein
MTTLTLVQASRTLAAAMQTTREAARRPLARVLPGAAGRQCA